MNSECQGEDFENLDEIPKSVSSRQIVSSFYAFSTYYYRWEFSSLQKGGMEKPTGIGECMDNW